MNRAPPLPTPGDADDRLAQTIRGLGEAVDARALQEGLVARLVAAIVNFYVGRIVAGLLALLEDYRAGRLPPLPTHPSCTALPGATPLAPAARPRPAATRARLAADSPCMPPRAQAMLPADAEPSSGDHPAAPADRGLAVPQFAALPNLHRHTPPPKPATAVPSGGISLRTRKKFAWFRPTASHVHFVTVS